MTQNSAAALEWEQVRALIQRYVATPAGREELQKVAPSSERADVEALLAETREGMGYLRAASAPQTAGQGAAIRLNFNGVPDIAVAVQKLRIEGASLDPREIFDLIAFLDRAADARSFLTAVGERFPLLAARAAGIGDFRDLLQAD